MSRDPDGRINICERCRTCTELFLNETWDEYWCDDCFQNEAEAAWERQQAAHMESPPESAREAQLRTWEEHQKAHKR